MDTMTDQATREAAADLIDGAIDVLHERGWCQNRLVDEGGRVCLVESLHCAGKGSAKFADEFTAAWGALSEEVETIDGPVFFNNAPSTTVEDVILTMKRASASLRDGAL